MLEAMAQRTQGNECTERGNLVGCAVLIPYSRANTLSDVECTMYVCTV